VDWHNRYNLPLLPSSCCPVVPWSRGLPVVNLPLRIRHIEIEILDPAIGEDWPSAQVADHLGGGGESHRGHNDTLPGLQADGFERKVQSRRAGIDRDGMFLMHVVRELLLELLCPWACGKPTTLESLHDLVNFLGADAGLIKGNFHDRDHRPPTTFWLLVFGPSSVVRSSVATSTRGACNRPSPGTRAWFRKTEGSCSGWGSG